MSSFDPFEARLHFLQLLRKLNASQQSIQKVVAYALKHASRAGEDLWDCVVEECAKGSLNSRINVLYFLDGLCEASLALENTASAEGSSSTSIGYLGMVARDLGRIVEGVLPESREGVLNYKAARQILESWRTRRMLDPDIVDTALVTLDARKQSAEHSNKRSHEHAFSRNDILRRMEEDRERHKRLRERIWILPIPPLSAPPSSQPSRPISSAIRPSKTSPHTSQQSPATPSPFTPASPSTLPTTNTPGTAAANTSLVPGPKGSMAPPPVKPVADQPIQHPSSSTGRGSAESALDVEFEQLWETCSDLGEEDEQKMRESATFLDPIER